MSLFKRGKELAAVSVQSGPPRNWSLGSLFPAGPGERSLYRELRNSVPVIDAAIHKLRRLVGDFRVTCPDRETEKRLGDFLDTVPVGAVSSGMDQFISAYFEGLLTYGTAVGEMIVADGELRALYNADLDDLELEQKGPLEAKVSVLSPAGKRECPYPELLLISALDPPPGSAWGVSLLRGLPFVSEVLLKVYKSLGINWERMGSLRFAVTCKPDGAGGFPAADRARQMAEEWKRAMRSQEVSDFVAVGDVSIQAIGGDIKMLDSEVPVRQMLEQIVAKLGLPPFLLGFSWSSTERMSSQQADVLTSELEAYRRLLTPVIRKVAAAWLALEGKPTRCRVEWGDITMQDEVDHANARQMTARARQIEETLKEREEL